MKLLFKQRLFSRLDSYDIYDETGRTLFTVEGQFSWGHKLHILDAAGVHVGTLKEEVLTFLPRFALYVRGQYAGCLTKKFTLFRSEFRLDCCGWRVDGNFMEWDYTITDGAGHTVAVIRKELFHWTDTYTIEVFREADALYALMITLAIDAEKCSRD